MGELAWQIFKKTGDIKYYLLAKKLEGEAIGEKKDNRNRNRGNIIQ